MGAHGSTTATPGPGRLLRTAIHPATGGRLARLRRSDIGLAGASPRPGLVAVLGTAPRLDTSRLAALLGQALAALAPGRVAVLDGDGLGQPQRQLLAAGPDGGLRQMIAAPPAWRVRRAVDPYLATGASVPLLATAATERGRPLGIGELQAAAHVLRRRYPLVVADLSAHLGGDVWSWAAHVADHVVRVTTADAPGRTEQARGWLLAAHPGRRPESITVAVAYPAGTQAPAGADVAIRAATTPTASLAGLDLETLAALEALVTRVTDGLRA